MQRYGKMFIIFLFFLNILFVFMGYVGISKLERYKSPPFNQSMMTVVFAAKFVPDEIILFWHSKPGKFIIWPCSILLPLVAAYFLLVKQKITISLSVLLLSIIPFGVVGFLIWLHAFVDLPHEW